MPYVLLSAGGGRTKVGGNGGENKERMAGFGHPLWGETVSVCRDYFFLGSSAWILCSSDPSFFIAALTFTKSK